MALPHSYGYDRGNDAMVPHAAPISAGLTVRSVTTRTVRVPLKFNLGTSAAVVTAAPLLLVDVLTELGATGRSYLFCYSTAGARAIAGHITEAAGLIEGKAATPLGLAQLLSRRFALLGVTGPVRMALSAIDIAIWDALAVSLAACRQNSMISICYQSRRPQVRQVASRQRH